MDFESTRGMSGLMFPEGPRWRDGLFWFSDILAGQVHAITPEGKLVESFDVPGEPSGLGWLPAATCWSSHAWICAFTDGMEVC